jgi:hypothetical protein
MNIYVINDSFVNFRGQFKDPRVARAFHKPVVMMAEIKHARWKGNGIAFDNEHPLVRILRNSASAKSRKMFEESIRSDVFKYYADYQPAGLWECVGVDYSPKFDSLPLPSHTHNPPWPWSLFDYQMKNKEKTAIMRNGKVLKALTKDHGVQHWGPSSNEKIEAEIWKFGRLFESIKESGFKDFPNQPAGFVEADILMNKKGEWRWMVEQGQHRVMMCSALDIPTINIKVRRVLTKETVEYFPRVMDGLYSIDQASHIFDRVVE